MADDVERHEQDKIRFLQAMLQEYEAWKETHPKSDMRMFDMWEKQIAVAAGLEESDARRIRSELKLDGFIDWRPYLEMDKPCRFTNEGIRYIERVRYERSWLGKLRRLKAFLFGTAFRKVLSAIGAILLALIIFALTMTELPLWVRWAFGETS